MKQGRINDGISANNYTTMNTCLNTWPILSASVSYFRSSDRNLRNVYNKHLIMYTYFTPTLKTVMHAAKKYEDVINHNGVL